MTSLDGRPRPAASRSLRRARGLVGGVVAAGGGLVAHTIAGGNVTALPAAVALLVAVSLAVPLTPGDRVAPLRVIAQAIGAQVVCHGIFLMSPAPAGHGPHHAGGFGMTTTGSDTASMIALHGAVALVTAAVALGADGVLLEAARILTRWLLPALPRLGAVRTPYLVQLTAARADRPLSRRCGPRPGRGPPLLTRTSAPIPT